MLNFLRNFFRHLFLKHGTVRGYDTTHLQKGGVPRDCDWKEWQWSRWIWKRRL